jgi:hypothetical protein
LAEESFKKLEKINIDLPGGQTGRQAIFSILENFLRNSAKHGGKELNEIGGKLIIQIKMDTSLKDYPNLIKVTISDNLGNAGTLCNQGGELSEAIEQDYIDENGAMLETNKGIKEMRISACWLRNLKDEKNSKPLALKAVNINGNIGFEFYLLKSLHIAIICDFSDETIKNINRNLVLNGWKLFTSKSYLEERPRHKFIIIHNKICVKDIKEIARVSHSRILIVDLEDSFFSRIEAEEYRRIQFSQFYKKHVEDILSMSGDNLQEIFIDDGDQKRIFKGIIIDPGQDYYFNNRICFKKHFLSIAKTKNTDEARALRVDVKYLESITGHNSTDRLIRKAAYDDIWYYTINESAQTKIAIFDERLWSEFSGISNDDINKLFNPVVKKEIKFPPDKIELIKSEIEKIRQTPDNDRSDELLKDIEKVLNFEFNDNDFDLNVYLNEYDKVVKNGEINQFLNYLELSLRKAATLNPTKVIRANFENILKLKCINVCIYNVIQHSDSFAIIRHDFSENNKLIEGFNAGNFDKVDEIKMDVDKKIEIVKNNSEKFHFVSIHQGILDKIYNSFKIKNNQQAKCEITNQIRDNYCYASHKEKKIHNLIIHSGRSKPAKKDMPQEVPFIQYSALHNAIKDCKFSLTEILYAARYDFNY